MQEYHEGQNCTLNRILHLNGGSIIDKEKVAIRPLKNKRIMSEKQARS